MSTHRTPALLALVLPALVLAPVHARAEPPEESRSPYELRPYIDVPLTIAALALWTLPQYAVGSNVPGAWCGTSATMPCDPGQLNVVDRLVVGHYDPTARPVANAFFA